MKQVEFRVRPVIRHIVTQYNELASSVVGEFDNEHEAEMVQEALDFQHAPRQYVCVKRGFEPETLAHYFDTQEEADTFVAERLAQDEEWRVFSRLVTDPIAKARILMRN